MSDKTLREAAEKALDFFAEALNTGGYDREYSDCYDALSAALADSADAPEGPSGTTLQYDAKNRLSYVWLIWVLHEKTNRWELQGICTSEAELTPRVRAIKNDPHTIRVRTEVAFVDHLFAAGETVGDYANRVQANRLDAQQEG